MKRTVIVLVSMLALLSGACSQIPGLTPTPGTGPTINPDDQFKTAVAQTLTARPSATSAAVTDTATAPLNTETPTPTVSPVISVTDTVAVTQTPTQIIDLSATSVTATGNVPTATVVPANLTPTSTLAAGQVTPIWTLAIRTYGTLPPAVPYSNITLVNKARTEAYISLQVTMPSGEYSIIEYPVEGRIKIQAPVGSYLYVTWVGGRKMVGEFRLKNNDDLTITLFRDRVVVQ
jgi:Predicted solute binding protein